MEEDGFTLVTGRNQKHPKPRVKTQTNRLVSHKPDNSLNLSEKEMALISRRITSVTDELASCNLLTERVRECLEDVGANVDEIVCYGLGSVTTSRGSHASRYQLAFLLLLRRFMGKDMKVSAYDPVFNAHDISILWSLNIAVCDTNDFGKRTLSQPTLCFMPRCPTELYNNMLWANWKNLKNLIMVGNDLTSLDTAMTEARLTQSYFFISKCLPELKTVKLRVNDTPLNLVLNNTVFQYFERDVVFPLSDEELQSLEPEVVQVME